MSKYVEKTHPGGSNFVMEFSDEHGADRTGSYMSMFVDELKRVANEYGFDIATWGTTEQFVRGNASRFMERVYVMREEGL